MLDQHTLHYAHLQSNKETTVWTCAFSLCMSSTLQMVVSIRNNSVAIFCVFQHPQPPRNEPHLSALLSLPPFPLLDEHALHFAHLQSNRETTVWTCAFSLCMSPILQMAVSIRNNSVASFCVFQHPQPPRNEPHLSALLCLPPFPLLDEHTLQYAHLQNNKQTIVWTCAFSLCMFPTLQRAVSIHNNSVASFCEECVLWRAFGFHLTAPCRL